MLIFFSCNFLFSLLSLCLWFCPFFSAFLSSNTLSFLFTFSLYSFPSHTFFIFISLVFSYFLFIFLPLLCICIPSPSPSFIPLLFYIPPLPLFPFNLYSSTSLTSFLCIFFPYLLPFTSLYFPSPTFFIIFIPLSYFLPLCFPSLFPSSFLPFSFYPHTPPTLLTFLLFPSLVLSFCSSSPSLISFFLHFSPSLASFLFISLPFF